MPTKKQLEEKNRRLIKHMVFYLMITVISLVAFAYVVNQNTMLQQYDPFCPAGDPICPEDDSDKFVYSYPTVATKFINISTIDPSCILDTRDYTNIGGNVWVDIAPRCVEVIKHTYSKE